jgi:hypothetical protein
MGVLIDLKQVESRHMDMSWPPRRTLCLMQQCVIHSIGNVHRGVTSGIYQLPIEYTHTEAMLSSSDVWSCLGATTLYVRRF